jgi:tRNA pseudouridine55 synthase
MKRDLSGWLNFHKPIGMTSAQAVNKVKWLTKAKKLGHAGTLDPLATGILPMAFGEATKCINLLMDAKKTYRFRVTFGERRSTDDAEGEVVATSELIPTEADIQAILPQFTGEILQMPPSYSALKVDGKRAYDLARAGEEVLLNARPITVHSIEFKGFISQKEAEFEALVGKGTYIRSLGRDIAQALGSEGFISLLHRASVGPFQESDAISLDFLEKSAHIPATFEGASPSWLLPTRAALVDIPAVTLVESEWQKLRHGHGFPRPVAPTPMMGLIYKDELVGLGESDGTEIRPKRLLNVFNT